jgi:hypothetical protein
MGMRFAVPVALATTGALAGALLAVGSCVGYLDVDAGLVASGDAAVDGPGDSAVGRPDAAADSAPGTDATSPIDAGDSGTADSSVPPDALRDSSAPPPDGCALDPYACAVLGDQPLLYLRFDETDYSQPALDRTGNGHSGVYPSAGATPTTGAITGDATNHAVYVDVDDGQGIQMPPCADFAGSSADFSIELWLNPDADAGGITNAFVIDHETFAPSRSGWDIDTNGSDIQLELWNGGQILGVGNTSTAPLTPGQWHYVVFVYLGGSNNPFVYVDNVLLFNTPIGGGALAAIDAGWTVGKQNCFPCTSSQFTGGIDELAIYAKPLLQTTVNAHYLASSKP